MKINEIFYSIQGEGPESGKPSIFIRTQGCNMEPKCSFCDSSYSWCEGKEMTNGEIFDKINNYSCTNIIFTGGEPTLQIQGIKDFENYCWEEKGISMQISIETNGLIYNEFLYEFCVVMVSPKKQNYNMEILQQIRYVPNTYFKFVYDKDLWFEKVIEDLEIVNERVYIMPEGKTKEEQEKNMEEVIEYCKRKKYKFCPRIHIMIWNNRRAV